MNTLILSNTSPKIEALNALTAPNKLAYAERHGYDFVNTNVPYENGQVNFLRLLRDYLNTYDCVMTIGCDTLFMNMSKRILDVLTYDHANGLVPGCDHVYICKEHISFWPINNDVMIWRNTLQAKRLVDKLILDAPIWLKFPWLWQNHLWNLIQLGKTTANTVKILDAKVMNATHQPTHPDGTRIIGPSSWQLGDWIIHFLNYDIPTKIKLAEGYLPLVSDGSFYPAPPPQAQIT